MSLEGKWHITFTTQMGVTEEDWVINATGDTLTISGSSPDGQGFDREPLTVDGEAFSFGLPVPNMPLRVTITGQLEGDGITGAGKLQAMQFGTFEGTRTG